MASVPLIRSAAFLASVLFLSCGAVPRSSAQELDNETCMACHQADHPLVDAKILGSSVHSRLQCASCHTSVTEIPHPEKLAPVNCSVCHQDAGIDLSQSVHGQVSPGQPTSMCVDCHGAHDIFPRNHPQSRISKVQVPQTCGTCHQDVLGLYEKSVHGKSVRAGKMESPVCTDCHGEHSIRSHTDPTSRISPAEMSVKVCGQCHAAERIASKYRMPEDRLKTYLESYHGLAGKFGITSVANCGSCHGYHDVLPSSDPASTVNKKNLPQTCGKCHPNVSDQLAYGSIHVQTDSDKEKGLQAVTLFYVGLIILVVGMILMHNAMDFARKLKEYYDRHRKTGKTMRFNRNERVQHGILAVVFCVLAYTGFALKFPEAWWAFPFTIVKLGYDWRGVVHRWAAVVFGLLGVYHIFYMLLTHRGREHLRAIAPRRKDADDFVQMVKYNTGRAGQRPRFGRYGYIEKFEYWAMVWGSLIMVVTGAMLTFESLMMQYFPKWLLDVVTAIHFYEAVLATLAIILWHFYFTIFDPELYPMNWGMWTGRSGEDRAEDEAGKPEGKKDGGGSA